VGACRVRSGRGRAPDLVVAVLPWLQQRAVRGRLPAPLAEVLVSARPLRQGARVRTADGAEGRVRFVDAAAGRAEVVVDGSSASVELPIAELRRLAAKIPPIEGMPDGERPRCPSCDRKLRAILDVERAPGFRAVVVRRVFSRWDGYRIAPGNGFDRFCSLRCARSFANAAWIAGYRMRRSS
jgi:hypothetical protein